MKNRIEGPWCKLGSCGDSPVWRTETERLFACDDFWPYTDWQRPKKGEEMRLVFSTKHVKGAQKLLVRNTEFAREFIFSKFTNLGMYVAMGEFIQELEPRELFEFYVWWWPEYREGEVK